MRVGSNEIDVSGLDMRPPNYATRVAPVKVTCRAASNADASRRA